MSIRACSRRHSCSLSHVAGKSTRKMAVSIMIASFLISGFTVLPVYGGNTRTQTFQLTKGWNAVYLSVEPLDIHPTAVFTNSPIDIATAYNGVFSTRQFTTDSAANMLSQLGWSVWYAPSRTDSFLSKLGAVHGQRGYLVHALASCTLNIEGTVEMPKALWQPSAFNLTGFCLDQQAPPTFSQFFSASKAHQECVIYRLVDGTWRQVIEPENEAMRSGEAFWIYCDGSSDYQGPLRVKTVTFGGVVLDGSRDEITLSNEADYPLTPVIDHVVSGGSGLPLAVVVDVIDNAVGGIKPLHIPMVNAAWSTTLPPLEAGASARVPLSIQLDKMTVAEAYTLLCIRTDIGTETWLPVLGLREDLK